MSYTQYLVNVVLDIGETGRSLTTRMSEHKRVVKNRDVTNGIAVHVIKTNHTVDWNGAQILTTEMNWMKRKIKEGLEIKRSKPQMNMDTGMQL